MSPDDPRHGTRRGYQAHRKDGENACGPCRAAHSEYQRKYDKANPEPHRRRVNARSRALEQLARIHRSEFQKLYRAELKR